MRIVWISSLLIMMVASVFVYLNFGNFTEKNNYLLPGTNTQSVINPFVDENDPLISSPKRKSVTLPKTQSRKEKNAITEPQLDISTGVGSIPLDFKDDKLSLTTSTLTLEEQEDLIQTKKIKLNSQPVQPPTRFTSLAIKNHQSAQANTAPSIKPTLATKRVNSVVKKSPTKAAKVNIKAAKNKSIDLAKPNSVSRFNVWETNTEKKSQLKTELQVRPQTQSKPENIDSLLSFLDKKPSSSESLAKTENKYRRNDAAKNRKLSLTRFTTPDSIAVIVNVNNTQILTSSDLKNIYLDHVTYWDNGEKIMIYNLPVDNSWRNKFSEEILKMSAIEADHAESNRMITNSVRNPSRVKPAGIVISYIERNPNAIAYVPAALLNENTHVKVIMTVP